MKTLQILAVLLGFWSFPVYANIHAPVAAGSIMASGHLLHSAGLSKDDSVLLSFIAVNTAGLLKEYVMDRRADSRDIRANLAGAVVGLVGLQFTFCF